MSTALRRARFIGAALVGGAFATGVIAGRYLMPRAPAPRQLLITTTDRIPDELSQLKPDDAQRAALQAVLRTGSERIMRIVTEFDPRMQAAVDSTDREIRALLTPTQLEVFDSSRKRNGPLLRRERIGGPPPTPNPK